MDNERYADGKVGRSQWDIVHMINFCRRVLTGEEPEQNPRAITKPVAVILLAHFLGDLEQLPPIARDVELLPAPRDQRVGRLAESAVDQGLARG